MKKPVAQARAIDLVNTKILQACAALCSAAVAALAFLN